MFSLFKARAKSLINMVESFLIRKFGLFLFFPSNGEALKTLFFKRKLDGGYIKKCLIPP